MGSVKDLTVIEKPYENKSGRGRFVFSDRYSVFDWGEMPDHIPNKGKSLCISAAYFFEKLENMGIKTHYLGLIEVGQLKRISNVKVPVDIMEVELLRVLKPQKTTDGYDYSDYKKEDCNLLVPLEVIFRNSLPAGSSVFKRLEKGELELKELGLEKMPIPGENLEKPFLDLSTKLEESDRYMNWKEAKRITNFSEDQLTEIRNVTTIVNKLITEEADRIGLKYEDGKIEFGLDDNKKLLIVDVLGTLDECRFTFKGMPISKEIARLYYRKSSWYQEILTAKKRNIYNWKDEVKLEPLPLPDRLKELISMAYCAFTNEITGRVWFPEIPAMKKILEEIISFI
ncbi:MAG: phosphoribosylaminoimidazolesuccinocarboxamide synthase [Candidatus Atribacteria bacterium]